jgi:hypothetical protein
MRRDKKRGEVEVRWSTVREIEQHQAEMREDMTSI